jgi:predicted Holliday junction resolvase-like endonuclease
MLRRNFVAMPRETRKEARMAGGWIEIVLLAVVVVLLLAVIVLMASIAAQLKGLRREAEMARSQLVKMDWSQLLSNGVQHLKEAVQALDTIDKRLQKLEALEKVQLSHINIRAGR